MLTYQLQNRVFKVTPNQRFKFPNDVEIEIYLQPTEQMGVGIKPSKTIRTHSKSLAMYDANTGKTRFFSDPALEPVEAILTFPRLGLKMKGNILYANGKCHDYDELVDLTITLHYIVPMLLNLEFAEPPTVAYTRGKVGKVTFNWELVSSIGFVDSADMKLQEQRIVSSFSRLNMINGIKNRRLVAALHYFHVARRLMEAGCSPFEFLSEVVLNLCKILQILFGESFNEVRAELQKLGYPETEIEEAFIPMMILRNEFDVGHVSVRMVPPQQLDSLHKYLSFAERDFRDLLKTIIKKINDREYRLQQETDMSLTKDKQKKMDKLTNVFKSRVKRLAREAKKNRSGFFLQH